MLYDFTYYNPTKIHFGKDSLKNLKGELANYGNTVLLAYGKNAIKKIGLYDELITILNESGKKVVELSGVMPNPTYEKVLEGASLVRENNVDLILAVGGGSVIDCAKAISVSAYCEGDSFKKYWMDFEPLNNKIVPVASVLTMVGTGSEMNGGSVITNDELKIKFDKEVAKLLKWGQKHITMLRFEDISVVVEGLHRGATDDLDSHAKRMDNRIIRSSTRLADYHEGEVSEWYEDKIITWDEVLKYLGTKIPGEISYYGDTYVRSNNGFIKKGLENNKDVKRGLYPLAIPMNFTFKINITELAHIYVERGSKDGGAHGTAAPELQIMIEDLINQIESWYPGINRELLLKIASNNV